jgi:hypothetical protein
MGSNSAQVQVSRTCWRFHCIWYSRLKSRYLSAKSKFYSSPLCLFEFRFDVVVQRRGVRNWRVNKGNFAALADSGSWRFAQTRWNVVKRIASRWQILYRTLFRSLNRLSLEKAKVAFEALRFVWCFRVSFHGIDSMRRIIINFERNTIEVAQPPPPKRPPQISSHFYSQCIIGGSCNYWFIEGGLYWSIN